MQLISVALSSQFDPNKRIYGILFASVAALFWGFLAIFIKVSLNDVSPEVTVWFRFSVAFGLLFSYFLFMDRSKFSIFKKPPVFLILAALSLTVNYVGFAKGVDLTSPGNAQIFIQLGPIMLAVVGIVVFRERLSLRQFLGFVVAGTGLTLFFQDQLENLLGQEEVYISGVLWVIVAALAWTVFATFQKILVQRFHAQQLNLVIFGLPILILIPFVDIKVFAEFTPRLWVLLSFLGIITIVAYGCLAEAFKYIEANKISVIITLNPILTFIIMSILGALQVTWIKEEIITTHTLIGALAVIFGAVMVVLPKKLKRQTPD